MHTLNKNAYILAMCLAALAGFVDVIGFMQLGGFFISFMSGNSTQFAVGLGTQHWERVGLLGSILATFVLGSMLGTLVRHYNKAHPATAVLALVTFLLVSAALCSQLGLAFPAIILMTLAMGAENAVFQRNGEVVVGVTYMTGALVKLGQRLANAFTEGARWQWTPYLLLWLGLILGGTAGAVMFQLLGMNSLWIAAAAAAILALKARSAEIH